jgi:hypothetical protein
MDLRALRKTASLLEHAGKQTFAVLNGVSPHTTVADEAATAITEQFKLEVCPIRMGDRVAYNRCDVITHWYREFLLQNSDSEEREYPDPEDQIREVLIHGNYLSQRDIDVCLAFDLGDFAALPKYGSMRELHDALVTKWGSSNI